MRDPALHHLHLRKRFANNLETYPHRDKFKRFIDRLIYITGIAGPFFTLPQVLEIWRDHNAAGVSVPSWISYCIMSIIWLTYGVVHKEKPIIYSQIVWIFFNFAVAVGAIIYG